MQRSEIIFILKAFFIWLIFIFAASLFAGRFVPLQKDFLGGGLTNYLSNQLPWSLSNFDGEHYLAIVQNGYQPLTYFFFPLYPIVIRAASFIFGGKLFSLLISGIFVSLVSFVAGLLGLYKLVRLDYKDNTSRLVVILLLVFPTSFYFAAVYTESLFFALSVWCLYFARRHNWLIAGILGALTTATRVIGLAVVAAIAIEAAIDYFKEKKKQILLPIISIIVSFLGIGAYIYYLWAKTGDPLNFLHTVGVFGAQRSETFVLLPQVFYRYIFKILPSLNFNVFSSFYPSVLEFAVALIFLGLAVWAFWKIRLSYAVYLALGYLIPTLAGSFSSLPRYVLVLFPAFILIALVFSKKRSLTVAFSLVSLILLFISFALFARGYWIS